MANERDREMESAMGPDEEPGEAKPAPADQAAGLGGLGTEGKAGSSEGGDEPQLPDITVRDDADIEQIIEGMPDLRTTVESPPPGAVERPTTEMTPEGSKPDLRRSPGERIRGGGA